MAITTQSLRVCEQTPPELRKADRAVQSLAGTTRSRTRALFEQGCVAVNGRRCDQPFLRLEVGDLVEVHRDPAHAPRARPKGKVAQVFEILHEDEHLVVVIKPAHWLTVPSPRRETDTLLHRVAEHLGRGRPAQLHAVQRLDRGVSGVLVFARTQTARAGLRSQLKHHEPERLYLALVAGTLEDDEGTFESLMATNRNLERRSVSRGGERAVTHWRVDRRLRGATLVRVQLETGRRNQIRVHFAEANHPVLGDRRYAPELARHRSWPARRMSLHAARLAFLHPVSRQQLSFEAPLPPEMEKFLRDVPTLRLPD